MIFGVVTIEANKTQSLIFTELDSWKSFVFGLRTKVGVLFQLCEKAKFSTRLNFFGTISKKNRMNCPFVTKKHDLYF